MQKLKQTQNDFYHTMFDNKAPILPFIKSDHPDERLNIYKQTILENLRHALEITYPGIWSLLGKACADSAAYVFCSKAKKFPVSGNLDEWGKDFPEFLALQPELSGLPYLKTYGEYEWLKHLAYGQLESDYVNYADLSALSENDLANCKLHFHPSVYLMQSDYPIDKIQEIIEQPDVPGFELTKKVTCVVIARPENCIMTYWVPPEYFLFFENMVKNLSLSECVENTEKEYSDFNIAEAIGFLMDNKLLSSMIK